MGIRYEINPGDLLKSEAVLALFEEAGISKPSWSPARMDRVLAGSAIVVCAHEGERLVGFANAISDFAWVAWLSQLAVAPPFQNRGIGRRLVQLISQKLGNEVTLLVHSRESAAHFYQSVGFEHYTNVYRIERKK